MPPPENPDTALLDFQRDVTLPMYAVNLIGDILDKPSEIQVVCEAPRQIQQKAERALDDAVQWLAHPQRPRDTEPLGSHEDDSESHNSDVPPPPQEEG